MRLILVRHGETTDNIGRIHQGWRESTLTPLGKRQAELLAAALAKEKIDLIYASDLDRVQETLEPLKRIRPDLKIVQTELLREQGKGSHEGKRHDEVEAPPDWNYGRFGGEEHADFVARVAKFVDKTLAKHESGTVCVYSHGGPMGRLALRLLGLPGEAFKEHHLSNAHYHIFEMRNGKWTLVKKNEGGHLLEKQDVRVKQVMKKQDAKGASKKRSR